MFQSWFAQEKQKKMVCCLWGSFFRKATILFLQVNKFTIICPTKQMFSEDKTFATFVCQSVCEKIISLFFQGD